MTRQQLNYAIAKSAYEAALATNPGSKTAEAWDKMGELSETLWEAERELVAWAKARVQADPATAKKFAANSEALENLFANYYKYPVIRPKFVQICMMLKG